MCQIFWKSNNRWIMDYYGLWLTRTAGASGPLVLESGSPFCLSFCLFVFTTTNHYHNWGVNIYYNTYFCSNKIFSILLHILPYNLPQTTSTNHNHNHRVNIYYHTNFLSNLTIFQFYHKFYHTKFLPHILPHILPQTTTKNHYHNHRVNMYSTPIFIPIWQF